jgi:dihydrofolate synthase/folylpolyglutamate synthase
MTPVDAILARLLELHPKKIDLSLERMWRILGALGHPERRVPPLVHVAGTNGKGSVIAFMRAILEAAGLSVHVYTSPHLVRFNERFRLGTPGGGRLVSDSELASVLAECERANGGAPITVFEMETAAAFLLFAHHPADLLLLEVGLGGRLDATNVVERPAATVITPISVDHVDFLGSSLDGIAREKAGILKRGAPALVAAQPREALRVIEREAARLAAPLKIAGEDWTATEERSRLVYQDENGLLDLPAPRLFGRHQFDNAGLAIAALRALPQLDLPQGGHLKVPARAFEDGVANVDWPARLQRLSQGGLLTLAPRGSEVWLDGGHNPDGGRAVAAALADLEERVSRPLVLIVGMLSTKDSQGFLRNFTGLARCVMAVPIQGQEKSLPPDIVAETVRRVGMPAESCAGVQAALEAAGRLNLEPPPRILITGSLYLAGEVLALNGTVPS